MDKTEEVIKILENHGIREGIAIIAQEIDDLYYEGLWITEGNNKRRATIADIINIANKTKC